MDNEKADLCVKRKEHIQKISRTIAELLNHHFANKTLQFNDDGSLTLSSDGYVELIKIIKLMEPNHISNEILRVEKNKSALLAYIDSFYVEKSNNGLLEDIIKFSKQYFKVMAIWGCNHFVIDDQFHQKLMKSGLSYVVLFPSSNLQREVVEEHAWQHFNQDKIKFNFSQPSVILDNSLCLIPCFERFSISYPEVFKSYFHPSNSI